MKPSRPFRDPFHATLALCLAAAAPASAQSLVAHWQMDETSGTSLVDAGTGGYDASLSAGASLGQPGAAGSCGASVEFDALSMTQATFTGDNTWDGLSADVSVSVWVNPQTLPPGSNVGRIFGNDNSGWSCGYRQTDLIFTTRFIFDYLSPAFAIPVDDWTHLVFVFDAGFAVTFYADGQLIGTVQGPASANIAAPLWIIGNLDSSGGINEYIDARLDDLQVYQGALTAQDVSFLHQNRCATLGSFGANYCVGVTNSTGSGAGLSASGTPSVGFNNMVLHAQPVPNQPGLFFYGPDQIQIPFGNGFRCVGGTVGRLSPQPAAGGVLSGPLDVTMPPNAATVITAGTTWNFQGWFRDPAAGGASFNLSDALEVTFGP